ncbi:MAG: hypothetical protein H3C51_04200 [Rubellimicrobium sp.]|nr:hypothetical protein [Rubellimicrobium sp.]
MSKLFTAPLLVVAGFALSGCLTPYPGVGPDGELPVIARPIDQGVDSTPLARETMPGVAYDPDGCQAWILDDGVEGYTGRRRDPRSGLPICNDIYPPGTVVREYQTPDAGIGDWVPSGAYNPPVGVLREGQCPNGLRQIAPGQVVCR